MDKFISKEILEELSYTSSLGRSLKQISLSKTPLETILDDISRYRAGYMDILIQENLIGSRFKSEDSIYRKYEKTIRTDVGLSNALMMYLVLDYTLPSILRNIQNIIV